MLLSIGVGVTAPILSEDFTVGRAFERSETDEAVVGKIGRAGGDAYEESQKAKEGGEEPFLHCKNK